MPATPAPHSPAFRQAALRSEVGRAYAVSAIILLMLALVAVVGWSPAVDGRLRIVGVAAGLLLLALQAGVIQFARWSARRGRDLSLWFSAGTVVAESLVPTGAIFCHILIATMPPFSALSSPPTLAYILLLVLTTLRLRPWLCLLAGAVAAASYTALLLYVLLVLGITTPTTGIPAAAYVVTPVLLLFGGLASAWVAREVRRHVAEALVEAETRRRMDRIEHDLAVAQSIQRALLPRDPPNIAGYEIAGWNRPADETGGDYYDWLQLPDGRWIVTLADVSGHGIGPALVTAACRAYVRASSAHHGDLASLAARVNTLLADDLPDGRFVTLAGVLLEPGGGPLALLSAGHGPIALYLRATGEVLDILPHGMPLAVARDTRFDPAAAITMHPGDVLALITDGFAEWSKPVDGSEPGAGARREQFGLPRLRESLRRHAYLPPAAMIEAVAGDAAAFAAGEPQQDDLTIVIIRRAG